MKRILIVDDLQLNINVLAQMLEKAGYNYQAVLYGETALKQLPIYQPDLIIMDIMMPQMDGFETTLAIKALPKWTDIPIIFISALNDSDEKIRGFEVGGVDYITRPFNKTEVLARINTHLTILEQKRQLERQAEAARQSFENLNTLKNNFIRGISHDIKNPIGAVIAFTEILKNNPKISEDPTLSRHLERIDRASRASLNLILNVLDLVRVELGRPLDLVQVNADQLLRDCFREGEFLTVNKKLNYHLNLPDDAIPLAVDWDQMRRAILNLITNAIKYADVGDTVEVSAEQRDGKAIIAVNGTGDGLPPETLPLIFEQVFQAEVPAQASGDSTGLELYLVKKIAEQHGGSVEVDNQQGIGTTFKIILPLASPETLLSSYLKDHGLSES